MLNRLRSNHLVILVIILAVGLGLTSLIPKFAKAQRISIGETSIKQNLGGTADKVDVHSISMESAKAADVVNNTTVTFTLDVTASNVLTGVFLSSAAWGDSDNDGDLDILLTGSSSSGRLSSVYKNTDKEFEEDQSSGALLGVQDGSVAWGDYDNDGDLDILLTGNAGSGNYVASVYKNTSSGFVEDVAASSALPGVQDGSVAWGDFDNDGDLDILLIGFYYDGSENYVASVFKNTGSGFEEDLAASSVLTGVRYSSAAWGDYDNDGDLDILMTGLFGFNPLSSVYENTGLGFVENVAASNALTGVYESSVAWGDYDNDDDLDILLTGCSDFDMECIDFVSSVFENTGSGFEEDLAASSALTDVAYSSAAWGDYDNDGDLDILLTGYNLSGPLSSVYKNTGSGFDEDVTASSVLTGVFYSSAAWGDYDNDGDLDILLTGGGKSFKPLAFVYRNNSATANMPPGVPGGLLSRQISDHQVSLSWEAPTPNTYTTPYSGLTYNLRVGTSPGLSDTLTPMSCVGSCGISGDGYRQIPMMGAANHGLTATLELPYGEYYWSVQAVDHTFAGSPWSKEERFFMLWMVELEINLDGDGSGSINSDPTGISCGSDCQEEYPYGTVVTLTASPEAGSIFSGWSGDCSGSGVCQVVMNDIKNVTAIFEIGNSNYLPVVKR